MEQKSDIPSITFDRDTLFLTGAFIAVTLGGTERLFESVSLDSVRVIDGSGIGAFDTAGAVFINRLMTRGTFSLQGFSEKARKLIAISSPQAAPAEPEKKPRGLFSLEFIGGFMIRWLEQMTDIAVLVVDILYWSAVGLFDRSQYRRGSFVEQAFYIGSSALPIVGTILFLIGAILTLQSAAQLRQFGASIFVVNMLALGLSREFAPLMTAIIVSGRSGSAIAAEIATMKFTEELDAIKTLGLNPIRFVVVPKFWAMFVCLPLLVIMALFIGIVGGFIVAITYVDLSPSTFMNQLLTSLMPWDIATGLIKSFSFAAIITIIGVYRGLTFTGGADGVGRSTTSSVVTSIFAIILMDSIWGILFYFKY